MHHSDSSSIACACAIAPCSHVGAQPQSNMAGGRRRRQGQFHLFTSIKKFKK
jgi:hypothetical protein